MVADIADAREEEIVKKEECKSGGVAALGVTLCGWLEVGRGEAE